MMAKLERAEYPFCRLCGEDAELQLSHVIPAFVFRDLKAQSATGHIRHTANPNVRVQDGIKLKWLCAKCEQRFSAWERRFKNEVLTPWNNERPLGRYSDWLLKFATSMSWRVLLYAKGLIEGDHRYSEEQESLFVQAEATWRSFLLDQRPHPGRFEQHIVMWDLAESTDFVDLPPNFNRFMVGAIAMDIVASSRSLYVWSKLGPFHIFGTLLHGPNRWEGTKIHVKDGALTQSVVTLPAGLMDLYRQKASQNLEALDAMSEKQRKVVVDAASRDIDRVMGSRTYRARLADERMFGTID